jgi:hypothetical protein
MHCLRSLIGAVAVQTTIARLQEQSRQATNALLEEHMLQMGAFKQEFDNAK